MSSITGEAASCSLHSHGAGWPTARSSAAWPDAAGRHQARPSPTADDRRACAVDNCKPSPIDDASLSAVASTAEGARNVRSSAPRRREPLQTAGASPAIAQPVGSSAGLRGHRASRRARRCRPHCPLVAGSSRQRRPPDARMLTSLARLRDSLRPQPAPVDRVWPPPSSTAILVRRRDRAGTGGRRRRRVVPGVRPVRSADVRRRPADQATYDASEVSACARSRTMRSAMRIPPTCRCRR